MQKKKKQITSVTVVVIVVILNMIVVVVVIFVVTASEKPTWFIISKMESKSRRGGEMKRKPVNVICHLSIVMPQRVNAQACLCVLINVHMSALEYD